MTAFLRDYDGDFGVLPMPKYDEEQTEYYNCVQPYNAPATAIPVTCSDTNRTGVILEALTYESTNTIQKAFYEKALMYRGVRDKESQEMLELIFANRLYDIGNIYQWGGVTTLIKNISMTLNKRFRSAINGGDGANAAIQDRYGLREGGREVIRVASFAMERAVAGTRSQAENLRVFAARPKRSPNAAGSDPFFRDFLKAAAIRLAPNGRTSPGNAPIRSPRSGKK